MGKNLKGVSNMDALCEIDNFILRVHDIQCLIEALRAYGESNPRADIVSLCNVAVRECEALKEDMSKAIDNLRHGEG